MRRRRPRLGQHFLVDSQVRERIVKRLDCQESDCWLEIGAGHGEMTELLAARAAKVLAVETDAHLIGGLCQRFEASTRVEVIHADILKASLAELVGQPGQQLRVYGNLPYYITSPILTHLFGSLAHVRDIFVVVQREVAERLAAAPRRRDYGYLSALAQLYTEPKLLMRISSGAFRPPPRVESALVRLAPPGVGAGLSDDEATRFIRFLSLCFRQKRKTLFNNLRHAFSSSQLREAFTAEGHDLRARAEELSVLELLDLHRRLAQR